MLTLPPIDLNRNRSAAPSAERLPLSSAAASRIERALLSDSPEHKVRELSAAIAEDENLASWTASAAGMCGQGRFSSTTRAGEWLAENLLALWAGHLEEFDEAPEHEQDKTEQTEADRIDLPQLVARLRLEQLESDFEHRLEHEKLEAMKELAYGAGHEINNPLANISLRAQTLLKEEEDPQRRRALAAINAQAFRAHEMIADLMLLARPPRLAPEPLELGLFLGELKGQLDSRLDERCIELTIQPPSKPVVAQADEKQLAVAITALCKNSVEAIGTDGHLVLSVGISPNCQTQRSRHPWAEISVTDDGPGIPPEVRPKLFDPFYSGREAGRGLGFGLSKCWRIVTDHGGHIDVDSGLGRGATFKVHLPLAS